MSVTQAVFQSLVEQRLAGSTTIQRMHSVVRLKERLRLIHNAVGKATEMKQLKTVTEFQVAYPQVYAKISPELAPYVSGGYLTRAGWEYFRANMYNPRSGAITTLLLEIRAALKVSVPNIDITPFE